MPGREALPALCFSVDEPFLPGSRKRLHLFEARTLGAAEDAVDRCGGLLAHICVADMGGGQAGIVPVASLARVVRMDRLEVGCEVEIVCEGRLMLEDAVQQSDGGFLTALCHDVPHPSSDPRSPCPLPDTQLTKSMLESAVQLEATLAAVMELAERLTGRALNGTSQGDTPESEDADDGMLWGHAETSSLRSAIEWAERKRPVTVADLQAARAQAEDERIKADDAPWSLEEREQAERLGASVASGDAVVIDGGDELAGPALSAYGALAPTVEDAQGWAELCYCERLSFAALQAMPAASFADDEALVQARARALALVEGPGAGLETRLELATSVAENQLKTLRAKVALLALDSE